MIFPDSSLVHPDMAAGTWTPHEAAILGSRRGRVAIDVGAFIGYTVGILAACHERVLALEPAPRAFAVLSDVVQMNNLTNVVAVNSAADLAPGQREFYIHNLRPMRSSFSVTTGMPSLRVSSTTLDNLCWEQGCLDTVDLIKIDVEGHAGAVLRGAASVIERCHPMVWLEFHSMIELTAAIHHLVAVNSYTMTPYGPYNMCFTHPSRAMEIAE